MVDFIVIILFVAFMFFLIRGFNREIMRRDEEKRNNRG
jgi:uncharacterized membrane protein